MPRREFRRVDLQIIIRRERGSVGGGWAFVGAPGALKRLNLSAETIEGWLALQPGDLIPDLADTLDLVPAFIEWTERVYETDRLPSESNKPPTTLPRLTLDVDDNALAGLAWEESLLSALYDARWLPPSGHHRYGYPAFSINNQHYRFSVQRVSWVLPRFVTLPLTLPTRILHLNPNWDLWPYLKSVFGGRPDELVRRVVRVREAGFGEGGFDVLPDDWPMSEILHFGRLPTLARPDLLLRTSDPDAAGTLGWFARRTETWQTRLVIIETWGEAEFTAACRLGHALTARGGPAILVTDQTSHDERAFVYQFYDRLVHDSPHDFNLAFTFVGNWRAALFGGAGREDALRFSNIGLNLMRLERDLSRSEERTRESPVEVFNVGEEHDDPELLKLVEEEVRELLNHYELPPNVWEFGKTERLKAELGQLRSDWDRYWFEDRESGGVLPMAERLDDIRDVAHLGGAARERVKPRSKDRWRYVNSSLCEQPGSSAPWPLPQKDALLNVGQVYQLRILVGPKDVQVETVGAAAIIEEVFKWTPEMKGVWLEIGVSGIDFEVLGAPVQELWLPRDSASDPVFFAVIPRRAKVSCLRFSVYVRQNVIQSFCLAALTREGEALPETPEQRRLLLAGALNLNPEEVGDFGYLPRLEYSTSADVGKIVTRPERGLSIVANDVAGRKVITLKGKEIFGVKIPTELKDYVSKIRDALKSISTPPVEGVKTENLGYAWGLPGRPNAGKPERLSEALKTLAHAGWQLFDRLITESGADGDGQRDELCRKLEEEPTVIHVAHTLLENVLPWGALYDRPYDPGRKRKDGVEVAQGVCPAALPSADGELPFSKCGESPQCLLHEETLAPLRKEGKPVYVPETVACPLHFWGFKHQVEVPAQQVSQAAGATEQQDCILPDGPVQLAIGYNQHFSIYKQHLADLDRVTSGPPPLAVWKAKECERDDVVDMLKDDKLDFIYLYCHAYASREEKLFPPFLEFGDGVIPARIDSADLANSAPWLHHPLVFLNGCGTAGFNPEAISPFIEKFVRDRRAAGVIGTEIPVWEQLASEFARCFLENFLKGISAGKALLRARRELLAKNNPLGLVYTLYGPAHLKIAKDGKCQPGA
jgi:hypothetical protein